MGKKHRDGRQGCRRDVTKKNHLLTLSLAEVSRSLGGQITFAILNETEVLLVLSRADQEHTTRAIFSIDKLVDFINKRVAKENLNINLAVKIRNSRSRMKRIFYGAL